MLLVIGIERNGEEQLDVRLRMVDGRSPDVSLAFILYVALYSLFDLQNVFLGQVLQHCDGFGLPSNAFRFLEEARNVAVRWLLNRAFEERAALSSYQVRVVFLLVDFV
jgi:hypothetical protein